MKVLFISRSYPPMQGGIENQNFFLAESLRLIVDCTVVANRRGKRYLFFFLLVATVRSMVSAWRYDAVLLGDAVLAPVGGILKICYPSKKVVCIVHGLDVTFGIGTGFIPTIYRLFVFSSLGRFNTLIAVSSYTQSLLQHIGIQTPTTVIPNGISDTYYVPQYTRNDLEQVIGVSPAGKQVLLLPGRYVKRKGAAWFIENVLPYLPEDFILVCAGARPKYTMGDHDEYEICKKRIEERSFQNRALLLSDVTTEHLRILYNTVDLVIMPNIHIKDSVEGFGLVALEAASCARVIIASDIEGIPDAIHHMRNGLLVPPEQPEAWIQVVTQFASDTRGRNEFGEAARHYTLSNFLWQQCAQRYRDTLYGI